MRKSKLTPEVHHGIMRRVRQGTPLPAACAAVGVLWPTCKAWLHKGRTADVDEEGVAIKPLDQPFVDFADAFEKARGAAISSRIGRVNRAGRNGNVTADIWWLEKRVPMFAPHAARKRGAGELEPAALPAAIGDTGTRTILLYPVPVPAGADPRAVALAAARGHAFERVAGDGDEESEHGG